MGRLGRYLEAIACFDRACRLALYWKLETALQDVGGFDSRMRVAPDSHPRVYGRVHEDRRIARRRTVGLRQNLSRDAGRGRSRRTLG